MLKWLSGKGQQTRPETAERRAALRYTCGKNEGEGLLAAVGPAGWPAMVCDISATGVGLVVGMRHEPGTWVPVRLVNTDRNVAYPMKAQVLHTHRRPDGYWFSGCVFEGALADKDLDTLL